MKRSFLISGILVSFLLGLVLTTQGSGIVPAIVPALVPAANKNGNSSVFALASSNALTASSPTCTDANGNLTTTACTANAVTSTTPVTVNTNTTNDQQLMELSLSAAYLNSLGRPFDFFGAGVYTTQTAQTPTLEFKIKLCTVSGCGSGTVVTLVDITSGATTAASSNISWNLRAVGTTAATGATGNLEIHGPAQVDLGSALSTAATVYNDTNTAVSGNIDLTAALFVDFTIKFSTNAATANTMTQREGVVSPGGSTTGGGGGASALTCTNQTLGANTATVTFSSIAGTHSAVTFDIYGRSSGAVQVDSVYIQFNGDSGTNYNYRTEGTFAQGALATATPFVCYLAGASDTANYGGSCHVSIPTYAGTTFFKSTTGSSTSFNVNLNTENASTNAAEWKNTAAITTVAFNLLSAGSFLTGSSFTMCLLN